MYIYTICDWCELLLCLFMLCVSHLCSEYREISHQENKYTRPTSCTCTYTPQNSFYCWFNITVNLQKTVPKMIKIENSLSFFEDCLSLYIGRASLISQLLYYDAIVGKIALHQNDDITSNNVTLQNRTCMSYFCRKIYIVFICTGLIVVICDWNKNNFATNENTNIKRVHP